MGFQSKEPSLQAENTMDDDDDDDDVTVFRQFGSESYVLGLNHM